MSAPSPTIRTPAPDYVLPTAPRQPGEVVVDRPAAALPDAAALVGAGQQLLPVAESQRQLLGELRLHLQRLLDGVIDESRARVQHGLVTAVEILEWWEAAHADLQQKVEALAAGLGPVDLEALVRRVAGPHNALVVPGAVAGPWWGDAQRLQELVAAALQLVAERTGGATAAVEVGTEGGRPWVRVFTQGEPADEVDPATVAHFRWLVGRVGARVLPDALGPGTAGMRIELAAFDRP